MSWREPQWPKKWPTALVLGLATLGPLGRWNKAPGTFGSAAGVLFFVAVLARLPTPLLVVVSVLLAGLAVGVCGEGEQRLGQKDPGPIVLDEFVAIPVCFLGWPDLAVIVREPWLWLLGFGLFRFFDIVKPLGIRALQQLPGGWGVVADDLAAALATCAVLHLGVGIYAVI